MVQRAAKATHAEKVNSALDRLAPTLAEIQRLANEVQRVHNELRAEHAPPGLQPYVALPPPPPLAMTSSAPIPEATPAAGPMCEPEPPVSLRSGEVCE